MTDMIATENTANTAFAPQSCRLVTGHAATASNEAWTMVETALRVRVRRLTTDLDLQEDWLQEAKIALWEIDATRFDVRDQYQLRYLRKMLLRRIWDLWKKELRTWTTAPIARPVMDQSSIRPASRIPSPRA